MSQPRLELSVSSEFNEASFASQTMDVMLTLKSLSTNGDGDSIDQRSPIDLVCVIDKSESMKGEKMTLMRKTLLFMVTQLKSSDRIALVTFDQSVDVVFPLTSMDAQGKTRATQMIETSVQAGNCTNLSGGILEGLDIMKKRLVNSSGSQRAEVASILLFTDGLANTGVTNSKQIVTMVQKLLKNIDYTSTVFTFGFGTDHDANMLRGVAEAGNGLYYYIDGAEKIPETFGDCLGGLLSVIAQNIKITVSTIGNGVEIVGFKSISYKKQDILPNHKIEVFLGDIYYEESKNLVLTVRLPLVRSTNDSQVLIKSTVNYFDVLEVAEATLENHVAVKRAESIPIHRQLNTVLDKQRNRIICANALETGRQLANSSRLSEARTILTTAINTIQNSSASAEKDSFCDGLIQDMRDCLDDMKDQKNYEELGSKKMNNYWMSSHAERSTNAKSAAQASYLTKCKKKVRIDSAVALK